jgi:alpha-beta hydrolase superfamily lysophospholipase
MEMQLFAKTVFILLGLIVIVIAGALAFGTSTPPPPLASVGAPFQKVDFSDLPVRETIPARSGGAIAFREWKPKAASASAPTLIAIHGSAGSSVSLHPLAKSLSAGGLDVYAPDIRGHGGTGNYGDIDYLGQLDDDLADFVANVKSRHPQSPLVLMGFSAGGGFALHAAGSGQGKEFARVVLISPMLGWGAPTVKRGGDPWATPFLPRIFALVALNAVGIHAFDNLPTLAFAITPDSGRPLTGSYSFRLMRAFATRDYKADLTNAAMPIAVLVGEHDELFSADLFAPAVHAVRPDVPVTIVPGLNHIEMTTDPRALPAILTAIRGS